MKRLTPAFALLLCASAWSAPPTLTSLRVIHSLTREESGLSLPVAFEATVTYYDNSGGTDLFVQDGGVAIYVYAKPGAGLVPGDRVMVRGRTRSDFRPDVVGEQITLLRHGVPPEPIPASFGQLIRGDLDCMRVSVRAKVRSADLVIAQSEPSVYLRLVMDGGSLDAMVVGHDQRVLRQNLDATVEVTGVAAAKLDSKMQLTGILIEVPKLSDVKVLQGPTTDPQELPITPIDEVLSGYDVQDRSRRVRTRGTITYYEPGAALVLQNASKSLWIATQFQGSLRVGQVVDVTGFPDSRDGYLTLTWGEIDETPLQAPVVAVSADANQLASGQYAFDLVSVEGRVIASVRGATQDEYVLESNGRLFSAIFRHPEGEALSLQPMKPIAVGSRVHVTGICTLEYGSDPLGAPVAFNVRLRSFEDIGVIAQPSWLNVRNLVPLLGLLLLAVIAVGARGWILERRVRRKTGELAEHIEAEAEMERRRSRILENINAGRPLTEILEQITALVSSKLGGAPCWCQTAIVGRIGHPVSSTEKSKVLHQDIQSHSGKSHGQILTSLPESLGSAAKVLDALSIGAWLCTLAIETRGLYTDLIHRSEFDLLTDVCNRFSLHRQLEALIEEASKNARSFGLIYIDLDRFKQVNDENGHLVGDLYLQEVALRMKRQLRPEDMLARLGGDEFGVLVPNIPDRAKVEEIALRLEHCFDEPFLFDGYRLDGAASVGIAVFPDDGTTKDSLLNAGDAAMYRAKNAKTGGVGDRCRNEDK